MRKLKTDAITNGNINKFGDHVYINFTSASKRYYFHIPFELLDFLLKEMKRTEVKELTYDHNPPKEINDVI